MLISGGWDNNIHIWDLRQGKSIHCLYGNMISGDTIDYRKKVILAGYCRSKYPLELWDLRAKKSLRHITWEYGDESFDEMDVYSAQFSKKSDQYILACGSGYNEARLFSKEADWMDFAKVTGFSKGLYTSDFASSDQLFAVAGSNGKAHLVKLTN